MDTLNAGARLNLNEVLASADQRYTLVMQPDGNLVLYDGWPSSPSPVWASNTEWLPQGLRPTYVEMQSDGNFVLYNANRAPAWASGTENHPGSRLVLQNDRNLVIYDGNNRPLWATNTVLNPQSVVVTAHKNDTVGDGKTVSTNATMYANGVLLIDTYAQNKNWVGGLRPRILVVAVDGRGDAIFVTDPIVVPALCSVGDPSCASNRRSNFSFTWAEVIAEYTKRLDIYQADNANYVDLHNQFVRAAQALGDIASTLKTEIDKLHIL